MVKFRLKAIGNRRSLLAVAVLCLFLLQALAFVFSPNGRIAFSSGDAGVSIAMAGEMCHAKSDESGKAPAQPAHFHHCALCSIANNTQALDAVALAASVIAVLEPRSGDAPAWFVTYEHSRPILGWTSCWSSRAPPDRMNAA
jgi:hypothetical protein